ncbi:MAG: DUF3277 family protein [Candidatus Obscuribacterales bacterium]|nr:DUF3277 family protein [Candidatus Obscuribacterales bacterium]
MSAGDFQGTYAAEKVIVTIGGVILSGFADGDFVTAKYDEDRFTSKTGADGEVGRAKNASKTGTIEIVLSASSFANDELSLLFNLGQMAGITPTIPVAVVDLSGRSLAAAADAWLKTTPDMVFGKEITDRTWTFACAGLTLSYGGNN